MANARPWLYVYMIPYLALSVITVNEDIANQLHVVYVVFAAACYLVLGLGVVLYATRTANDTVRKVWQLLFPILVLFYLGGYVLSFVFGMSTRSTHHGLLSYGLVLAVGIVLFLPALWASYILAYGKREE